jgi:Xaa-Pro aminopeptidase
MTTGTLKHRRGGQPGASLIWQNAGVTSREIAGIAGAQRVARAVVHDVADTVTAGDTERGVAERLEAAFIRAGVRAWFHTPYAWFGERTRFAGFHHWEPDALPGERRLAEREMFILDAAPMVEGHPADYAYSGALGPNAEHFEMRQALETLKAGIVRWSRTATTGAELFEATGAAVRDAGFEVVHHLYPAAVLGHRFDGLPRWMQRLPRIGWGFQPSLIAGYAVALFRHALTGTRYPFINDVSRERPQGIFAIEPHLARRDCGAKFESILVVDGDETRWLDPGLFGEVEG